MSDPICLRISDEMRALAGEVATAQGVTLSEWIRVLMTEALYGNGPDINAGYIQARGLALKLSHELLRRATELLPPSYEEAVMYFGLAGPGRGVGG